MGNNQMQPQRMPFSVTINSDKYKKLISNTIKDQARARRFVSSIVSAVAVNPALQECTPKTIISGALLGESLNLSPSPQLGQYYLVPFDCTLKDQNGKTIYLFDEKGDHVLDENGRWVAAKEKRAQFQLGYKGIVQLALRSGHYRRLNVVSVKDGELNKWDPITEDYDITAIDDEDEREKAITVGYIAYFQYLNGFKKTIYWSRSKMLSHADRYSAAFSKEATGGRYPKVSFSDYESGNYPPDTDWLYSSFWYKDFDGMAHKTMLKQLISKWGIMSIDLQTAFEADATTEKDEYFDMQEPQLPEANSTTEIQQDIGEDTEDQPHEEKQVRLSDIDG